MSDNPEALRTAFEQIMAGPPYERDVRRFPDDGRSAWPGNYRDIAVDLAWCVLRDCAGALAQQAATPAPAGWKLVPVEPTEEMLAAAYESDRQYTLRNFGDEMTVLQGPWDHWVAMIAAAPPATPAAQPADEREAFETAMRQTWKMIDPLHPPGQPGSYARGEHNGIAAALRTVRENFNRAALKGQPEGQG